MRNKLISIGLFSYGALISWAVTADHLERKYDESLRFKSELIKQQAQRIDRLIEETIQEGLHRMAAENTLLAIEGVEPDVETNEPRYSEEELTAIADVELAVSESEEGDEADDEEEDVIPPGETEEETRSNLQRLIDTYTANEEEAALFALKADRQNRQEVKHKPPYIISQHTFAWDEEGESHDKITLTYYPRERILLDDDLDPIEDVAGTVGWRSLSNFGSESDNPDVVFVRNERLRSDFEVVRENDDPPPLHVRYGMPREEFETHKAAGLIKFRPGEQ